MATKGSSFLCVRFYMDYRPAIIEKLHKTTFDTFFSGAMEMKNWDFFGSVLNGSFL